MNDDLDIRDVFAMAAMVGWIVNGDYSETEIAKISYDMADRMIEERKPSAGLPPVRTRKRK